MVTEISNRKRNGNAAAFGGVDVGRYPVHHHIDYLPPQNGQLPLCFRIVGSSEWRQGCTRWRRHSDTFSVEFVTSGVFEFTQDGHRETVCENELFFVRKGCDSEMRCASPEAAKLTLGIDGELLEPMLSVLGLSHRDVLVPEQPEALRAALRQALELAGSEENLDFEWEAALLSTRLLYLLAREVRGSDISDGLRAITQYLEVHLDQRISMPLLAERFQLSQATLFRMFQEELQESPGQFLSRKRMEMARLLLRQKEDTIKSVAFKVDIPNPLYFSTEFRRLFGMSPKAFREQK